MPQTLRVIIEDQRPIKIELYGLDHGGLSIGFDSVIKRNQEGFVPIGSDLDLFGNIGCRTI